MARIICLANSYKRGGRCIAGIDMDTREWVRPFNSRGHEGAIGNERLIDYTEPKILDVLEIPIGGESENYGCQPENRILLPGRWGKIGTISPGDALEYVEKDDLLLHNEDKKVDIEFFGSVSKERWKSLQLIQAENACFSKNHFKEKKWECNFQYGRYWYDLKITDPTVMARLDAGEKILQKCLLTISMGGPFSRGDSEKKQCWKMVAGVIEL